MNRLFRWQYILPTFAATLMVAVMLHGASQTIATNPPVVNFGSSTLYAQTNWDGGVGTNTSSQYTSITNLDAATTGQLSGTTTGVSWYNTSWAYRREITINSSQVSSTQTNFPILLTESNFDAAFFSHIRTDGLDVVFTSADGTTLLDREIAYVSTTAQAVEAWVRIPTLSGSSDTVIYAYYGNSGTSVANNTTTWDSSIFNFVAHLNEDPASASNPLDSSQNASVGTYVNSPVATSGIMGTGVAFDGVNQHITFPDAAPLDVGDNHAYSVWYRPTNNSQNARVLTKAGDGSYSQNNYSIGTFGTLVEGYSYTGTSNPTAQRTGVVSAGVWHKVDINFDRANNQMQSGVNGSFANHDISAAAGTPLASSNPLYIGIGDATPSEPYVGTVDEVRVYSSTVSTSWFATEYNNQSNPGTFATVAAEEAQWYDTAWSFRRQIDINPAQVSSTQSNFPVLLTGTGFDSNFFSNITSSGLDIVMTDADGTTILPREIVSVSTTASTMEAYVSIPTLSDTVTTSFFVYYGNSSGSLANSTTVWSAQRAVWHMEEDPSITTDGSCGGGSSSMCDSTVNANHATSTGFTSANVTSSPIGNAYAFGTGRRLNAQSGTSLDDLGARTVSFWMYGDSAFSSDNNHNILKKSCSFQGWQIVFDNDNDVYDDQTGTTAGIDQTLIWDQQTGGTDPFVISGDGLVTDDTWHYATFVWDDSYDGTSGQYYLNGNLIANYYETAAPSASAVSDACGNFYIGANDFSPYSREFHGGLDEMRIASGTISSSYILTDYNNQSSPATFYSVGSHSTSTSATTFTTGTLVSAIYDVGTSIQSWGTVRWTSTNDSFVTVKARSSNDSGMSGATAFDSCSALSQDQDLTSDSCVTDGHQYLQYQVELTTTTVAFQDITFQGIETATTSILESGGTATIYVTLDETSGSNVTVPFTVSGSSTAGTDHDLMSGSIVITAGNLFAVTTTNIVSDSLVEFDETLILTMGVPTNGQAGNQATYNLTITDDDFAGVTLTTSSLAISEAGVTTSYSLALQYPPTTTVTIALSTSTDSQVTLSTSSIDFNSSTYSTPVVVTVTAVDDALEEGSHTGVITHVVSQTGGPYNGFTISNVTTTITDNDAAAVTLTTSSIAISEAGTTATYTIQLASQPTSTVTIGATSSLGQVSLSTTSIEFNSTTWNVPVTVTVTAVDDASIEGSHSAVITHTSTQTTGPYNGLSVASVGMTITDNESVGITSTTVGLAVTEGGATTSIAFVLDSAPTTSVTITFGTSSQGVIASPSSLTFSSTTWNVAQTTTISAYDDAFVEGAHTSDLTFTVANTGGAYDAFSLSSVSYSITDNDAAGVTTTVTGLSLAEGGSNGSYTVVLLSAPTNTVTINLTTSTDQATVSPASLTFNSSTWSVAQTVTVSPVDDSVADGPGTTTITHTIVTTDTDYAALSAVVVTTTVSDNDTAQVTVTESSGSTSVTEPSSTDSYTVVLTSQPSSTVTITLTTSSADFTVSTSSLTFTSSTWNSAQTVTVTARAENAIAESTVISPITHAATSADTNYNGISVASVTTTVNDNDTPNISLSSATVSYTEGSVGGTYTVSLTTMPSSSVTVAIATSSADADISTTSIYFTSTTYNATVTVTVSTADDTVVNGTRTVTLTHTMTSADANYNGVNTSTVTATIADDDATASTDTSSSGGSISFSTFANSTPNTVTTYQEYNPNTDTTTDTNNDSTDDSCQLTPGRPYRSAGSNAVYRVTSNCTLRPFRDPNTFFTYYDSWTEVETVPAQTFASVPSDAVDFVPAGPKYDPQYGALVKIVSDPRVFLLLGGERYWISSETVFNALGYQWSWIEDVAPELLDQYAEGSEITRTDVHPNFTLVKYADDPKVYRLEPDPTDATKQVKRHILSESVFTDIGMRFDRIVTIPASETYADGEPLGEAPAAVLGISEEREVSPVISYGESSARVAEVQKALASEGFFSGSATGIFGGSTLAAVRAYQVANDINPTGNVGPLTKASLGM